MSSLACTINNLPPVPSTLDIPTANTPIKQPFFALTLGLKHKKLDCSPSSTPEGQSSKRTHTGINEGNINSGHSTLPIQLVASHSPKQPKPELINLPSSQIKAAADPDDRLAVEASGSTIDHDRDSAVEDSRDDAEQSGDGPDSNSDSQESAADSGPKSANSDCLTYSGTKEVDVNSTHKKFWKKAWAFFKIT